MKGAIIGVVGLKHGQVALFLLVLTCPESLIGKVIPPLPNLVAGNELSERWGEMTILKRNRRKRLFISDLVLALVFPLLWANLENYPSTGVEDLDQPNDPISTGFCQSDYMNHQQANENEHE